jgi:DNA-binding transcriptional regulator YiaG
MESWQIDLTKTEGAEDIKKLIDEKLEEYITIKHCVVISAEDFAQIIYTIRERLEIKSKDFCSRFGISERVLKALENADLDWKAIRDIFDPKRDHRIALAPDYAKRQKTGANRFKGGG